LPVPYTVPPAAGARAEARSPFYVSPDFDTDVAPEDGPVPGSAPYAAAGREVGWTDGVGFGEATPRARDFFEGLLGAPAANGPITAVDPSEVPPTASPGVPGLGTVDAFTLTAGLAVAALACLALAAALPRFWS
jgi:hypothetical protein